MRRSSLISKVSIRGQTAIPRELRQALGIKPGTKLAWNIRQGALMATPAAEDPVKAVRGMLKGKTSGSAGLLEERRKERQREEGGTLEAR
ncbi:MAG: AbrB/MazE/SpoVT family DNA-binding domain-containing protein [Dehalococcoidia bacterium]|nr:AbrB/MazE/SpoVT family DNA-binding domain-containing protein [Dehalococcoidia bacterium]